MPRPLLTPLPLASLPLRAFQSLSRSTQSRHSGKPYEFTIRSLSVKVGALSKIRTPHREGIEPELGRHLVDQALEGEADIDGAVAAEGAAGRRIGEHAAADIFDVMQVVDGVEH